MPKSLLTTILTFLTILGLIFLIWPQYQKFNTLKLQEKGKETQLQERRNYFLDLQGIFQKLEQNQEVLEKIDTAIPQDPEIARLLHFLSQSAQNNGLLLTKVGSIVTALPQEKQQEEDELSASKKVLRATTISFQLIGDYPSLKNFLALLEKSARLIEVERISFLSTKANFFQFELEIKVNSY